MKICSNFDSGLAVPYSMNGQNIQFEIWSVEYLINILIKDITSDFYIDFLVDKKGLKFMLHQGLVVSEDGVSFTVLPFEQIEEGRIRAYIKTTKDSIRISSRFPYGRDQLEKLICETNRSEHVRWSFLEESHRGVPYVEFGEDDGHCPIHYFIAGEDAWETAGTWAADEIVRELSFNAELIEKLSNKCLIRVVPLVSPYSATKEKGSYCKVDGEGIYGAATWGDELPPPEYKMLRDLIESSIEINRLGYMMTMHSWQAQSPKTELEAIKEAGGNRLSESRINWAEDVMSKMINGVPKGNYVFPEKIWHDGLAREYFLKKYNLITFRVEVSTYGLGLDDFKETGRRFVENILSVNDWRLVYPEKF